MNKFVLATFITILLSTPLAFAETDPSPLGLTGAGLESLKSLNLEHNDDKEREKAVKHIKKLVSISEKYSSIQDRQETLTTASFMYCIALADVLMVQAAINSSQAEEISPPDQMDPGSNLNLFLEVGDQFHKHCSTFISAQ